MISLVASSSCGQSGVVPPPSLLTLNGIIIVPPLGLRGGWASSVWRAWGRDDVFEGL